MQRYVLCFLMIALLGIGSAGCSTLFTFGKVYGGTRTDAALLNASSRQHPHNPFPNWIYVTYAVIDLPFSFVLDTLLLPITVPWYFLKPEPAEKKDKQSEPSQ